MIIYCSKIYDYWLVHFWHGYKDFWRYQSADNKSKNFMYKEYME